MKVNLRTAFAFRCWAQTVGYFAAPRTLARYWSGRWQCLSVDGHLNRPPPLTRCISIRLALSDQPSMRLSHVRGLTLADLSRVIAETRAGRQLTQRQLAQLAGVSQPWIASVEAGKARMDMALVLRVLTTLGLRLTLQGNSDNLAAMTVEESPGKQSTPSGPDARPKKSTNRYVIEVRTAKGESLVLTTVEWSSESRRKAINQILHLAGFAKPAVDKSPKRHSLVAKSH